MAKGSKKDMNPVHRIVLTGPECTGKSTLAEKLAEHYHTVYIPEYARDYVAGIDRPYTFEDVEHIAKTQQAQAESAISQANGYLFLDTYLIITKIWFEVVYGKSPEWVEEEIKKNRIDLYLLCDTSIPWIPDGIRENGGEMRNKLFLMYKSTLEAYKCPYIILTGTGEARYQQAIQAVDHFFS